MKLTVLGSGTAVPSLQRNSAAYLIRFSGENTLVDCGYGTIHQLLRLGLTYHDIDRILFTHVHPDHLCDLVPLLFAARYPESPRRKPLTLIGAPGFRSFFETLTAAFRHWLIPDEYVLRVIEQDGGPQTHGALSLTAGRVRHMDLSRAWRLSPAAGGKSIVLSGDTDYSPELAALAKDCDLLVLECSFPDEAKVPGHLTPREAGCLAREVACKKLLLTHFYPSLGPLAARDSAAREYPGEILLAEDRLCVEI